MAKSQETPEQKAERLESENTVLKGKLADANAKVASQNTEIKNNKDSIKMLQADRDNLESDKNEVSGKYTELEEKYNNLVVSSTAEITALSEQVNSASKDADSAFPILTRNRKKFKMVGKKFNFEGNEITVDQIKNDGVLADRLIEKGVGFLIPMED